MTPPTKLVVGPWKRTLAEPTRDLRYGSKAHGYEVIGTEIKYRDGYVAFLCEVIGEPRQRNMASQPFRYSYQAHAWFMQTAKTILQEVA